MPDSLELIVNMPDSFKLLLKHAVLVLGMRRGNVGGVFP